MEAGQGAAAGAATRAGAAADDVGDRGGVLAVEDQRLPAPGDPALRGGDEGQPPVVEHPIRDRQGPLEEAAAEEEGVARDRVPKEESEGIGYRPRGVQLRGAPPQRLAQLVDQLRVVVDGRRASQGGVQEPELVGPPDVVLVAGNDELAAAELEGALEVAAVAEVPRVAEEAQPGSLAAYASRIATVPSRDRSSTATTSRLGGSWASSDSSWGRRKRPPS
jgi:hypothetical protein